MKRLYIITFFLPICIGITTITAAHDRVIGKVEEKDVDIRFNITSHIDEYLENPVLEYRDNLYVSMRDMAECFYQYNVDWDEESRTAAFYRTTKSEPAVKSAKTAQIIAKAVAKGQFGDKVSEKTQYYICEDDTDAKYYGIKYIIHIYFDKPSLNMNRVKSDISYATEHADTIISIKAENGVVDILKR